MAAQEGLGRGVDAGRHSKRVYTTGSYCGSASRLMLFGDLADPRWVERADALWGTVLEILCEADRLLSTRGKDSDVACFNQLAAGESVTVRPLTASVVELALEAARATDGVYDPTVGPLVDLWGLSPRVFDRRSGEAGGVTMPYDRPWSGGSLLPPTAAQVDAVRRLVDYRGVELSFRDGSERLAKRTPSVVLGGEVLEAQLDLGGVAKGCVVDRVLEAMGDAGFAYGSFSCDSSIGLLRSAGCVGRRRGDGSFTLRLTDPRSSPGFPQGYLVTAVRDSTVSTSGDYGRYYKIGPVRVSHLINPRSGFPAGVTPKMLAGLGTPERGVCTVTLLGPLGSAGMGDALATALCLMGVEEGLGFYNDRLRPNGWKIVMVVRVPRPSEAFELYTDLEPGSYHLMSPGFEVVRL